MSSGVIVGYDGSEHAQAALRVALEVAKVYGDKVIVAFGYDLSPVGGELHDYHTALKNLATKRIEEATEVAAAEGAEVDGTILEHGAAHGLAQLATDRNARMIVIGTRGEGPLRGAILGSTAHKLLHLSDRPVLVVPV